MGRWSDRASRWALPIAGLLIGAWAIIPPYVGPRLQLAARAEVADHVVPGIVLIALSLGSLGVIRRDGGSAPSSAGFVIGLITVLAGLWMTATHVPLLAQVSRGQVTAFAATHHSLPGLAVMALGVTWVALNWRVSEPGG